MKLVIFLHSLSGGGAERVAASLADYWTELGWTIVVVTIAGREGDFYSLHPAVRRTALGLDCASASSPAAVVNNLKRIQALRRVLRNERPDAALAMMPTANVLLAMAAGGTGIPAVGSERIHPPMLPLGRAWEFLRRRSYRRLSAVVAQTEESAHWLRTTTGVRRTPVIPNPVNYPLVGGAPRVAPDVAGPDGRATRTLLAVGRLDRQKGFDRLLRGFAQLSPRRPDWRLVIAGDGAERDSLEEQIDRLGLAGRVALPGAVGNIGEWYAAADLFVMTSRFEGFPNTLLEALAHGLPAISVDCQTGPREILRHEIDGLLVPQDDQAALVAAMERLTADEALRRRFSARAVEARERFAIGGIARLWANLFDELIENE